MKKLLSVLAISALLVACSNGYEDKADKDGKDTIVTKEKVKDTAVVITDTVKK